MWYCLRVGSWYSQVGGKGYTYTSSVIPSSDAGKEQRYVHLVPNTTWVAAGLGVRAGCRIKGAVRFIIRVD
jgi:hypothetical protein